MNDDDNGMAHVRSTVTFHHARFAVLTDRLIRMEWAKDQGFEDRPTLMVCNRRMPVVPFTERVSGDILTLKTDALELTYRETGHPFNKRNLNIRLSNGGERVTWRYGQKDRLNLRGTCRTLDLTKGGARYERRQHPDGTKETVLRKIRLNDGLLSRSGWSVIDDSGGIPLEISEGAPHPWVTPRRAGKRLDLYFFGYGHDYKAALRDGAAIFGRQPLPPRYVFGYWYSKFWAYTDKDLEQLVRQFDTMGVPIDVLVVDMDWHKRGWTGYSWDPGYFPDPEETLRWLKDRDLKITLNLHPADGVREHEDMFSDVCRDMGLDPKRTEHIPLDTTSPRFMAAYFKHLHHPNERLGVDFWWLDWQQGDRSRMEGLDPLPWLNQLHWKDQEETHPRKRPLIFSRFGGIGSGRYPVGFSGDTVAEWDSLAYQPYFTATAANVLYGYWSHDIGGHMPGPIDGELYVRWMQFGAYAPILRTHTTKNPESERRVWAYPDPYAGILADTIKTRYELVPYIYSEARQTADTGISLAYPLYYDYPGCEDAYRAKHQYMFGRQLMVAPVTSPVQGGKGDRMAGVDVWLPPGNWYDAAHGQLLRSGRGKSGRWTKRRYLIDETPVFLQPGAVIPGQTGATRIRPGSYPDLRFTVYPGAPRRYALYEDDGISTAYTSGTSAVIPVSQERKKKTIRIRIGNASGRFKGFRKKRFIELCLPGCPPPVTVTLDAHPIPWRYRTGRKPGWRYDAESAAIVVTIPSADITRRLHIEIELLKGINEQSVDGLKGLFARLKQISNLCVAANPAFTKHPDERLATTLYQTANRISRRPQAFRREIKAMTSGLTSLPAALDDLIAGYGESDRERELKGYLQAAQRMLMTTLKQFPDFT